MSLETYIETGNQFISEGDRKRMAESAKVHALIPILGAVVAIRTILQKSHRVDALNQQQRLLDQLNNPKTSRDYLIGKIFETQEICMELTNDLNPNCHVDDFAFYMRRIHILSVIFKNKVTDDIEVASMTTDLILGKKCFDISKMEIVKEYNQRMAQLREQYL